MTPFLLTFLIFIPQKFPFAQNVNWVFLEKSNTSPTDLTFRSKISTEESFCWVFQKMSFDFSPFLDFSIKIRMWTYFFEDDFFCNIFASSFRGYAANNLKWSRNTFESHSGHIRVTHLTRRKRINIQIFIQGNTLHDIRWQEIIYRFINPLN